MGIYAHLVGCVERDLMSCTASTLILPPVVISLQRGPRSGY